MKKLLHLLFICFLALIGLEKANAENVVYKTLDFAKASESKKVYLYAYDWTATDNGDTWLIHTFNNNGSKWNFIRYKAEGVESYPYIVNQQTFPKEVTKIEITVNYADLDIVKDLKIYVGTDSTMKGLRFSLNENVHKYYFTEAFKTALNNNNKSGVVTCNLPHPNKNSYYRIHFVIEGNYNHKIEISKIVYYTSSVQSPDFSGATAFLDTTTVKLSSLDQGAKIYYTTDGTEPTDQSTAYTAPFTLDASATVKAISYLNGEKSNVASQEFKKVENSEVISVAQALKTADNAQVYIKANVVKTDSYDSNRPSLNYYIADTENAANSLEVLNGRYLQDADITNADQIVRGDEVIVKATVKTTNKGAKVLKDVHLISIKEYQDQAKVSSAGWATFVSRRAVDFPKASGLSAYTVKYDATANQVTLSPVTAIPGNTAVVVKANAGTYDLQRGETSTTVENNDLTFSWVDKKVTAPFTIYVLAKQGDGCGFYPVKANETLAPFKGYLTINTASSSAAKPFYAIGGNTTTGINNAMVEAENKEGVRYNLAGQRVNNNYKGLVIVNGHKVIIK